ncbi:MAG: GTPase HflX [Kiritimatiellia bacterium]
MKQYSRPHEEASERAILVQLIPFRQSQAEAADSLAELERLADTAGVVVAGRVTQRRRHPTPQFLVGEGKLQEIQLACRHAQANLIITDNDLTPVQVNNLDQSLGIHVIDRTELILQIFARRASSATAKGQVELAQLEYLVSRIPVSSKQQRFQGGIGMRGPGESPLQLRNDPMRKRIKELKGKLEILRARGRRTRERQRWPTVSLVGYTNAGKSTLLNALSSAGAYVDDRLFATLDVKTRQVYLGPDRLALLSDTVGFIRHLPHGLVASFRSTLDVAVESDILLVVLDASDPQREDHLRVVGETLREIGADAVPTLLVLNKMDCLVPEARGAWMDAFPAAIVVSARTGEGLPALKAALRDRLEGRGAYLAPVPPPPPPWET